MFQSCKFCKVIASRKRKVRVQENSDKQVLMDFQRQANYRERQRKLSSEKELKKKACKTQKTGYGMWESVWRRKHST